MEQIIVPGPSEPEVGFLSSVSHQAGPTYQDMLLSNVAFCCRNLVTQIMTGASKFKWLFLQPSARGLPPGKQHLTLITKPTISCSETKWGCYQVVRPCRCTLPFQKEPRDL